MADQQAKPRRTARTGWAAVDVLALVCLLLFLGSLAAPLIGWARDVARRRQCEHNLNRLGTALAAYHAQFDQFPPAAVWSTSATQSLALDLSKSIDRFTMANWCQMLLPFAGEASLADQFHPGLPVAATENAAARTSRVPWLTCPADDFNRADNRHVFQAAVGAAPEFARGNYAINGGSHCFKTDPGSTATPAADRVHVEIDREHRQFRFWGNGIAGFNRSFSLGEFQNGAATLVAIEEIRAGIHPADPRGCWAQGQVGASVTWSHGVNVDDFGPNNLNDRSDDILGCRNLHEIVGPEKLAAEAMPCVWYVDKNQNATARSRHEGGVNVMFVSGSVRFISDGIDPGVWHVMHSRETPAAILGTEFDDRLTPENELREAPQPVARPAGEPARSEPFTNSAGIEFALIPAGTFTMGLPDDGADRDLPTESPAHRVNLTRPYWLGRFEVTQSQYEFVVGQRPAFHRASAGAPGDTGQFPVEQVTWSDALAFCDRLSELPAERAAGRTYRLPSEAEWERACRAGSEEPYAWRHARPTGDATGETAGMTPALPVRAVGSYPPNAYGLFDMRGNVWEWCADWFDRDYYSRSPLIDPRGPARGVIKVVRGGDWVYVGEGCHINYPMTAPWMKCRFIGFRVVCDGLGE